MTQFLLIAIAVLAGAVSLLFLVLKVQKKSLDTAKSDLTAYKIALDEARHEAESLQTALKAQAKIEEKAHAERQELSKTADSGLVDRANSLF